MDLDGRAYFKLTSAGLSNENFAEYRRILEAIFPLREIYDYKTPKMWCFYIHNPFRKILEENPRILSKNGYIQLVCVKSCMKVVEILIDGKQIIYIVVYATS
jgi:hypothetical protein